MSVKIRLARFGKHKVPFYHVVVTDSRNRRDSGFIEKIGTLNPLLEDGNKEKFVLKKERAEYWLGVGAIPTDRITLLFEKNNVKGIEKYSKIYWNNHKKGAIKKGEKTKKKKNDAPEKPAESTPAPAEENK